MHLKSRGTGCVHVTCSMHLSAFKTPAFKTPAHAVELCSIDHGLGVLLAPSMGGCTSSQVCCVVTTWIRKQEKKIKPKSSAHIELNCILSTILITLRKGPQVNV